MKPADPVAGKGPRQRAAPVPLILFPAVLSLENTYGWHLTLLPPGPMGEWASLPSESQGWLINGGILVRDQPVQL
jgi:hypothetical protein